MDGYGYDGEFTVNPSEDKTFDFEIKINTGLENGKTYSLVLTARGASGQSDMEIMSFTYDATAPEITINTPVMSEKVFLSDAEFAAIQTNTMNTIAGLQEKYNKLKAMSVKATHTRESNRRIIS